MQMLYSLTVVMVSQAHTFVKTYQNIDLKTDVFYCM